MPEPDDAEVGDPYDPADLPIAQLGGPEGDEPGDVEQTRSPRHLRAIVVTALAVVVIGLVVGIVLVNSSAPPLGRGESSPRRAAQQYVRALNAGDGRAAAAIACDTFTAEAQAQARTGADPGIRFTLRGVASQSKTAATALLVERVVLPGHHVHSGTVGISVLLSGARWLMCGRAG